MDRYSLPTETTINGKTLKFDADFRTALLLFRILNDPDLLDTEKVFLALENFYDEPIEAEDFEEALKEMMFFLACGEVEDKEPKHKKPLYDWDKDYDIIVAPINRIVGKDVRGLDFFHWWTFISAFMEIGECTFNTYVGIRDKINRGKRLEKWEEKIYQENRDKIFMPTKVDSATQSLIDELLGKEG